MRLFYKEYGQGQPLVILHGLLGSGANWHSLSRNVFAKQFHVFVLDLRNHGQSGHTAAMNYQVMAEDVRQFLTENSIENAHVLGHSMGGKVAMELAIESPDSVNKLVVVDISPFAYASGHMQLFEAMLSLDLAKYDRRREVDAALEHDVSDYIIRQFLLKNLYRTADGYSWRVNLPALIENYGQLRGQVTEGVVDVPTLFIRGEKSRYITDEDVEEIEKQFLNSDLVEIPGAGHWVHAEQPNLFAEAVITFLTTQVPEKH